MIPTKFITKWRTNAPWAFERQVEQDLIISRALVELFNDQLISESVAFRGGTALYKLFVEKPARYSEDIDLVQLKSEPIGSVLDHNQKKFSISSDWFSGEAMISTYHLNELMGTKMRALYQRKKGRDLFD